MNMLAQVCKLVGHSGYVFEDGDFRCSRCGQGFYEGLAKALRADLRDIRSAENARKALGILANLRYIVEHTKGERA